MSFTCPQCGLSLPLDDSHFPFTCACGHRAESRSVLPHGEVAQPPNLVRRFANFTKAAVKHVVQGVVTGKYTVDDDEFASRTEQCRCCATYFDAGLEICTHASCGCGVGGKERFIDKRRLASSTCPIGRWAKPKPTDEFEKEP